MMRYAVFICPECRQAFSNEAKTKRTKCPRCNKGLKLDILFRFYQTNDLGKASEAVRRINLANLAGENKEEIQASIDQLMAEKEMRPNKVSQVKSIEKWVAKRRTDFTLEKVTAAFPKMDPEKVEKIIFQMHQEGRLVERKPGVYSFID